MPRFQNRLPMGWPAGSSVLGGCVALVLFLTGVDAAEKDGWLHTDRGVHFPIGFYVLPDNDDALKELAESGVNLVRCHDRRDLDRCRAAGIFGWVPLSVQDGPTEALRERVQELRDHPALAVWEGPDEVVWNFTAFSGLAKTAGFTREDWQNQTPKAVAYARREAEAILPRMRAAIEIVRQLDTHSRPFWINEAGESDALYVRRYIPSIDATGCDFYPIKAGTRDLISIGKMTDRWRTVGRGKPVWMVLQAFSWHKVRPERYPQAAYPTFAETRFMAWDALMHGARGIFYWGSEFIDKPEFRPSVLAMTAELAAVEPFLMAPPVEGPRLRLIEADLAGKTTRGVRLLARRVQDHWLIVLVNEDDARHMGVEISGLDALNGRELHLLYGDETVRVAGGEAMTRMQAYETKVFATSRQWESRRRAGRDFP